jgi:CRP-like cAMP-binding protein
MQDDEKSHRLEDVELFAGLTNAELAAIEALASVARVPPGMTLAREGASPNRLYVVLQGEASVLRAGRMLGIGRRGFCFGTEAWLGGTNSDTTVVSTTAMTLFVLTGADLATAGSIVPRLAQKLRASSAASARGR